MATIPLVWNPDDGCAPPAERGSSTCWLLHLPVWGEAGKCRSGWREVADPHAPAPSWCPFRTDAVPMATRREVEMMAELIHCTKWSDPSPVEREAINASARIMQQEFVGTEPLSDDEVRILAEAVDEAGRDYIADDRAIDIAQRYLRRV